MIISPKNDNLLKTVCDLVLANNLWPYGQHKIGNYIINMNRFPDECLEYDGDRLIDGYVITPTGLLYNDKTFIELLNEK